MATKEKLWEIYIDQMQDTCKDEIELPLRAYFSRVDTLLIFNLQLKLDDEIKEIIILIFEAVFH